jgi:hypothetical protein
MKREFSHLFLEDVRMKSLRLLAGMLVLVSAFPLAIGCARQAETPKAEKPKGDTKKHDHEAHGHGAGPHDGAVADWGGGKFHVELLVDHDKQKATVYVLGSDEKTPAPVKAKDSQLLLTIKEPAFQVVLKADPEKGDPAGTSSRFIGTHEKLGKVQDFQGTISADVDGTPYVGPFKEEAPAAKKEKK